MGRKCSVEGCLSDSNRTEDVGVTFHKVPPHSDVRPKWLSLCRIPDDKKLIKVIYICSRHFLRADFCNFKGKKYMLRQGVLPSVFPWDKSKLEAIKAEAKKEKLPDVKNEPSTSLIKESDETSPLDIKQEPLEEKMKREEVDIEDEIPLNEIKIEPKEKLDDFEKSKLADTTANSLSFAINSRIEALDFNSEWFPARIVEVDYEENEVLIHFEKFSSKYDEWICMNSSRLRPLQVQPGNATKKGGSVEDYTVGERCLAAWSNSRKFPATVTKVMDNDVYEVLFDDGFVKTIKAHRMSKAQGKQLQACPLFDPIKSSKQDRRDKKRKLNVAALFKKRARIDKEDKPMKSSQSSISQESQSPKEVQEEEAVEPEPELPVENLQTEEDIQNWKPRWIKGKPVGIEATIETQDGPKTSVIVPDPRLPEGWHKHLLKRTKGTDAGKWDTIIVSPENKRFRSKTDVVKYLEEHASEGLNLSMFDFSLVSKRKKKNVSVVPAPPQEAAPVPALAPVAPVLQEEQVTSEETELKEEENANSLKILFEDDAYKCPIEGCGKTFRKENLAQMHVKHYHPEYTKFLDSTPNVADLAYARTVGENLDRSPGPAKPAPAKTSFRTSTPKITKPPIPAQELPESKLATKSKPVVSTPKSKDSEIIKLLNSKPFDKKETETIQPLPSGLPMNMYPDIKLKDLLNRAEGVPKRDDLNLKTLCSTRISSGIKTLLPVVRQPPVEAPSVSGTSTIQEETPKQPGRRKRPISEHIEIIKGGEVIKIVRMKQEEIINCTCGFTEEDGLMIQCELCLCWQHAYCNNIERESQVPEKYICSICQNPLKERYSRKFYHDQDWLKQGTLPVGSYHSKDDEALQKRFEKMKKSHDISGGLHELQDYLHSLSIKMKIAGSKNHPKLYLWSKPWDKQPLPEKIKQDEDVKPKVENEEYLKSGIEEDKDESQNENSMLMMILREGRDVIPKIDLNSLMDTNGPIIPQPEAAIDSTDCRLNLLDHIIHQESLVEERLDDFEKQIEALEQGMNMETDKDYPVTRHTLQMLTRDLDTLKEISQSSTL
nr:PHD finger protein 20 [Leptinotarsa decemlineata]